MRIDHVMGYRHKLFGSFYRNHRDEFRSNNGWQGTFANQGQWPQTRNNHGGTLDWVTALAPTSVLDLRGGFTRFLETSFQSDVQKFDASTLGFVRLPGPYMPRINLEQYMTGSSGTMGVGNQGVNDADNTLIFQGFHSKTYSRHTLKYGGE